MKYPLFAASALVLVLSACQQQTAHGFSGNAKTEIDQSKLCYVQSDDDVKKCQPNELVFFAPPTWGSERFSLNMVAWGCNTNYQIIHNNSGVICVFTNQRMNKENTPAASTPAK